MTAQQIGDGNTDGVQFPDTKAGFFGASPVAKPVVTWPDTTTATTTINETKVNRIMAALVSLGLIETT
jgi:hypothetical protein